MKKTILLVITTIITIMLLVSCDEAAANQGNNSTDNQSDEVTNNVDTPDNDESTDNNTNDISNVTIYTKEQFDKLDHTNLNIYDVNLFDFDKDGAEEKLVVYTSADIIDGDIMLDDGQKFAITYEDENDNKYNYILETTYLQIVLPYYSVLYDLDDNLHIMLELDGSSEYRIYHILYKDDVITNTELIYFSGINNMMMDVTY